MKRHSFGFFHPFTNDGGGGERVLWCAVRAIQELDPLAQCFVYTGDVASPDSLAERAHNLFGVVLPRPVEVVRLSYRHLVEASLYPRFTLLGQSLGSMALALEAVLRRPPAVFVDTAGYAFSYPVVKLLLGGQRAGGGGGRGGGCLVVCYTHYPTISGDMLQRVQQRTSMYNNDDTVANSAVLSSSKLYYYRFFAYLYGWAGGHADVTMVNSSWTEGHIRRIWTRNKPSSVHRVYPPCDTAALQALPLSRPASKYIISVAQFRPEKNHALQLRAFAQAIKPAQPSDPTADAPSKPDPMTGVRLKLVGSSRHREDEKRIELLGCLAVSLGIERRVDFIVNTPFRELQQLLGGATCGIHTMWDEHFGISVVEYMAAGAIPIAHNSAGPKMDIVVPACHAGYRKGGGKEKMEEEEGDGEGDKEGGDEEQSEKQSEPLILKGQLEAESLGCPVGFLATTEDEYAAAMRAVFAMSAEERERMATAGRERAKRFSEENFDKSFKDVLGPVLGLAEPEAPVAETRGGKPLPAADPAAPWSVGHPEGHPRSPFLRLHQEIVEFCRFVEASEQEKQARAEAVGRVTAVIQSIWAHCHVEVFGSYATGVYLPTSDVDVSIPAVIGQARVPIIKFLEIASGVSFDISFDTSNGPETAKFIRKSMKAMPALRPISLVLKLFLQQRGLNEVFTGGIGSYALLVMIMTHLQTHHSRFSNGKLEQNLGVLLIDFFHLYGRGLNTSDVGVSARHGGRFFLKRDRGMVQQNRFMLAVEDPQMPSNDLSRGSHNIHN
ncbi:unnamed protein product, partial [Closterium sp. Yama58-4]